MSAKRLPFIVDREGDQAIVAMDCGKGVIRGRPMPTWFLQKMATMCRRLCDEVLSMTKEDQEQMESLAAFPNCNRIASCDLGPCNAVLFGSKNEQDEPEFSIAFYDADDDSAPVLLLIEEQIQEFISRVSEIMKD